MKEIKIAVITDDNIDYIYIDDENFIHAALLKKYLEEKKYLYDPKVVDTENANSMSLFLREQGNAIFLNDTTYVNGAPGRHGKSGIVIFPDKLSDKQKDMLKELNSKINDFDQLEVWYDFSDHLECKRIYTQNKDQVNLIIDYAISKFDIKTK